MTKAQALAVSLVLSFAAASCSDGGRAVAEAALEAAEGTLATVRIEAVRYVPDQVKAVEGSMAAVRDEFAQGDYTQVLTDTKALTSKISAIGAAAAAKKAELTTAWQTVSSGMPQVIQSIQSRVEWVSKQRRLPRDLSREAFDAARSGLEFINRTWAEATDAFKAGNLAEAMAKATTAKTRAAEVMTALNMQVPAALK